MMNNRMRALIREAMVSHPTASDEVIGAEVEAGMRAEFGDDYQRVFYLSGTFVDAVARYQEKRR
jgi:hypothetical protein